MRAGFDEILPEVWKHPTAVLDVGDFSAGAGTVINAHALVVGTRVHLGREAWIDQHALIGGGSAYDSMAGLDAGHWLHLGSFSQVNIARGVTVGDEVGIGIGTTVFTHGAYLSEWDGFPVAFEGVRIGSRVWLPSAQVNPGTTIGDDVVVAAGSLVNSHLPSRALAGGTPAKVLRADAYPRRLGEEERAAFGARFVHEVEALHDVRIDYRDGTVVVGDTTFDLDRRTVDGAATPVTEKVRDQLRRRGIRFAYETDDAGGYTAWS